MNTLNNFVAEGQL